MKTALSSPPGFRFSTGSRMARGLILMGAACGMLCPMARALDTNGNGLNDVWEIIHGANGLTAGVDTDGDGATNAQESAAGTNPFDANSRPGLQIAPWSAAQFSLG